MNLDMNKYKEVRTAQAKGARTVEELKAISNITIESDEELRTVESLLQNACKCKNVSIQDVVNAVNNGADTVDKVIEITKAGSACGRCKSIITNIVEHNS